jgi:Apea-like HEPN
LENKDIHFIGFLANVDDSILKLDLGHPFKIEKKPQGDTSSFLRYIRQDYGIKSEDGILAVEDRVNGIVHDQSFYYYGITASNIESFEGTSQGVVIRPAALERFFYTLRDKIRLLRLFKEGNVLMRFSLFYHLEKSEPKVFWSFLEGPLSDTTMFQLRTDEIVEAQNFVNKVKIPFDKNFLQLAFESFELSYETYSAALNFLSLMVAMEVMLNRGRDELKYSISRNAAVLLGKSSEHANQIFEEVKNLYKKRSEVVHTGAYDVITKDDLLKLRGYVRETIKEICTIGKNKDELTDMLNTCGFGQRPWRNE